MITQKDGKKDISRTPYNATQKGPVPYRQGPSSVVKIVLRYSVKRRATRVTRLFAPCKCWNSSLEQRAALTYSALAGISDHNNDHHQCLHPSHLSMRATRIALEERVTYQDNPFCQKRINSRSSCKELEILGEKGGERESL